MTFFRCELCGAEYEAVDTPGGEVWRIRHYGSGHGIRPCEPDAFPPLEPEPIPSLEEE